MRKKISMAILVLLLSVNLISCNKVEIHEDVNEEVAKDAMQLVNTINKNVKNKVSLEKVSEEDEDIIFRYASKYIDEDNIMPLKLSQADEDIVTMASSSLIKYAKGIALESDIKELEENEDLMMKFIETGKPAGE